MKFWEWKDFKVGILVDATETEGSIFYVELYNLNLRDATPKSAQS